MTPEEFNKQLNAAQSEFENVVTKLAMTIAEQKNPYIPGIGRCAATLNVLSSARQHDWEKAAIASDDWKPSEPGEGLSPGGCESLSDTDLPPAP